MDKLLDDYAASLLAQDAGEKWVTVNGGSKKDGDGGGSHVLIDGSGKIVAGMGGKFTGVKIDDIPRKKFINEAAYQRRQQSAPRIEAQAPANTNTPETAQSPATGEQSATASAPAVEGVSDPAVAQAVSNLMGTGLTRTKAEKRDRRDYVYIPSTLDKEKLDKVLHDTFGLEVQRNKWGDVDRATLGGDPLTAPQIYSLFGRGGIYAGRYNVKTGTWEDLPDVLAPHVPKGQTVNGQEPPHYFAGLTTRAGGVTANTGGQYPGVDVIAYLKNRGFTYSPLNHEWSLNDPNLTDADRQTISEELKSVRAGTPLPASRLKPLSSKATAASASQSLRAELNPPALTEGSDKQVAWAKDIRDQWIKGMAAAFAKESGTPSGALQPGDVDIIKEHMADRLKHTDAKYWIDHRSTLAAHVKDAADGFSQWGAQIKAGRHLEGAQHG